MKKCKHNFAYDKEKFWCIKCGHTEFRKTPVFIMNEEKKFEVGDQVIVSSFTPYENIDCGRTYIIKRSEKDYHYIDVFTGVRFQELPFYDRELTHKS